MTSRQEELQQHVWERLWSQPVSYEWDSVSETVYQQLTALSGGLNGLHIAEAGSGTGKISLRLAKEGAKVTLIDYSQQALANSQAAFQQEGLSADYLLADIREIPLPDHSVDLTWNAGVLEHFSHEEQVRIVQEMIRITKPGGLLVILTPSAASLPYRLGKFAAERSGRWMYGQETPVVSMEQVFRDAGLTLLKESPIGFLDSLAFLDFIAGSGPLKEIARQWYDSLEETERQALPGYLLCSVGQNASPPSEGMTSSEQPLASAPKVDPKAIMDRIVQAQQLIREYHEQAEGTSSEELLKFQQVETSTWLPLVLILDQLIQERAAVGAQTRVLDIGPAYGTLLLFSALLGAECYGLDNTAEYWPEEPAAKYGMQWIKRDIEAAGIPGSAHYDIVLLTSVLEHLRFNPLPVLRDIHARLIPQGSLLLTTPWKRYVDPLSPAKDFTELPDYSSQTAVDAANVSQAAQEITSIKLYSIDEIYALAEAAGFRIQSLQPFNSYLQAWLIKK
ncbi:methyltransferase domain-containing protein [Paenibacillus sanguinis]|uniref:methyltransferase domain-containing protein n=1 Tax=Paenibacillus sanguinis TaxID=225906 RepID=UPI00037E4281|nr:methyltransferase domain-containing protein [Paenibacillus sanguinis]